MRKLILTCVLLASGLAACPEDKAPGDFDLGEDAPDLGDGRLDDADDEVPESCNDHDECPENYLCVEGACMTRDEALTDCFDHDECPDDFLCFEGECIPYDEALVDCEDDTDCPLDFTCVEDTCEEE